MGIAAPCRGCTAVPTDDKSAGTVCTAGENGCGGSGATRTAGCRGIGGITGAAAGVGTAACGDADGLSGSDFCKESERGRGETTVDGGALGAAVTGATPRSVAMTTGGGVIGPVCVIAI